MTDWDIKAREFVTRYQHRRGLEADGLAGDATFGDLDKLLPLPDAPERPAGGFDLNSTSLAKLSKVDERLARVVKLAAHLSPIRFIVTQGLRTQAEQDALYAQGRTTPGKIVTWTRASNHLSGRAVDLAPVDKYGKVDWDDLASFKALAAPMKEAARDLGVEIDWGGDWPRNKDYPHYELEG